MLLVNSKNKIEGSTNSGLIDATVYFLSSVVNSFLVNDESEADSVGLTERNTLPYAGGT